jgi:uncharacterized protein YkwD
MKAIRVGTFTANLVVFVWMAMLGNARPRQSEATGVWHHFGESVMPAAPAAPTTDSVGWHRFGDDTAGTPTAPRVPVPETLHRPRAANVNSLEMEMFELVNRARLDPADSAETGGRALPLRWDADLAAVAREHSRDMLMRRYFGHNDPDGRSPGTRIKAAGIPWQATAENIAAFDSVTGAETAFMNEPRFAHNHRGNILNPKYTEMGIGIVRDRNGRYYITQEFIESPADLQAAFPQ